MPGPLHMEHIAHSGYAVSAMSTRTDLSDVLASLTLFADLTRPKLDLAAHTFEEVFFREGQRVLRRGFSHPNLYVILEGEAMVVIEGTDRARLHRGDFFGEVSVLLGEPATADVVAITPLRCVTVTDRDLRKFLLAHPEVTLRLLQAEARRLRQTNEWRP